MLHLIISVKESVIIEELGMLAELLRTYLAGHLQGKDFSLYPRVRTAPGPTHLTIQCLLQLKRTEP